MYNKHISFFRGLNVNHLSSQIYNFILNKIYIKYFHKMYMNQKAHTLHELMIIYSILTVGG